MLTESTKAAHILVFLQNQLRCVPGRLLNVWDDLPEQWASLVKEYLTTLDWQIHVERLPAYAAELNPVECILAYLKQHELPNACPKNFWDLSWLACEKLNRMRRRPRILTPCWKQSDLCF